MARVARGDLKFTRPKRCRDLSRSTNSAKADRSTSGHCWSQKRRLRTHVSDTAPVSPFGGQLDVMFMRHLPHPNNGRQEETTSPRSGHGHFHAHSPSTSLIYADFYLIVAPMIYIRMRAYPPCGFPDSSANWTPQICGSEGSWVRPGNRIRVSELGIRKLGISQAGRGSGLELAAVGGSALQRA